MVDVDEVDAGGLDPDEDLPRPWHRRRNFREPQDLRPARGFEANGLHVREYRPGRPGAGNRRANLRVPYDDAYGEGGGALTLRKLNPRETRLVAVTVVVLAAIVALRLRANAGSAGAAGKAVG